MQFVFRVDADPSVGAGHLYRCLNLADALRERGHESVFAGSYGRSSIAELRSRRHPFHDLPTNPDPSPDAQLTGDYARSAAAIIVDRPSSTLEWELEIIERCRSLVNVVDRPSRQYLGDLFVSTALFAESLDPFRGLIPKHTPAFTGPTYMPLSSHFSDLALPPRKKTFLGRLHASFGSSDPGNQLTTVAQVALEPEFASIQFVLLAGPLNESTHSLRGETKGIPNVRVIGSVRNMAEFWAPADLGMGSFGMSAWERCALGLGSLATVQAPDQREDAYCLQRRGAVICLGLAEDLSPENLSRELRRILEDPELISELGAHSLTVMERRHVDSSTLISAIEDL